MMVDRDVVIIKKIAGNKVKPGEWVYKKGKKAISDINGVGIASKQFIGLAISAAEPDEEVEVMIRGAWNG
jgi:hypothetical protein